MKGRKFYIIAGEASGDHYGADLVNAIRAKSKDAAFIGFGGEEMAKAGVKISRDLSKLEIIGFAEVLFKAKDVFNNFRIAKKEIIASNVDAIILIDYPGFNLRIAKWAKKRGLKIYYFVAPQTWAWKEKRNEVIKKAVDKLFVILPFEKDYFQNQGIDVVYVGHPLAQSLMDKIKHDDHNVIPKKDDEWKVAVLPGSRQGELKRMIPILSEMINKCKDHHFIIAGMSKNRIELYQDLTQFNNVELVMDNVEEVLTRADVGIIKSGTSTLQAALYDLPQLVFYKVNGLSAFIMRKLAKIKYISLPNLILDKALLAELIQEDLTPQNLLSEFQNICEEKTFFEIKAAYQELREKLSTDIPVFEKTAEVILSEM